jgi:hypothetical protein
MSVTLLIAYLDHYRPMLAAKARINADPGHPLPVDGGDAVENFGRLLKPLLAPLAVLSLAIGIVQVGWLLVMVAQHAADPKAIHEVRPMTPRTAAKT